MSLVAKLATDATVSLISSHKTSKSIRRTQYDVGLANSGRSSSVVGDGGASWRIKALKRAQEQAAREGRNLKEVAEERWGSLGQLTVSAAHHRAAPAHAHLRAINDRKRGITKQENGLDDKARQKDEKDYGAGDVSVRHPGMREPKVHDSLSWRKRKDHITSKGDTQLISAAASCLNKFTNDGSFMRVVACQQRRNADGPIHTDLEGDKQLRSDIMSTGTNKSTGGNPDETGLCANLLAAKAMQLRLKGKHEEAEKLLEQAEF
ncbi:hypothetical protein IFM89_012306 [Coptis chinensis]|uniref:Uncharacterized protein n=1 Tax=Coptis chinensis TaxID=261450 RepID=A0A835LIZ3_9MAGN|nr:hypothetical protein IFM89_012306 [Coptis chinensis]